MTPPGYLLRDFLPADYDAVYTLWLATPGIGLNESDTPSATAAFLARNPGLSCVALAESDRALAGAVLCGHDGRRGYLHHLAVAPVHRQRGLGRALVNRCLAGLRSLGIAKCNIFLYADNVAGRAFWQRQGWTVREDLHLAQISISSAPTCSASERSC